MAELFQRRIKLAIAVPVDDPEDFLNVTSNVVEIEKLRVQFKVEKSLSKEPNTAEVVVTNLSQQRRAELQSKGAKFILQAGYEGFFGQLFIGDVRTVNHLREGADWNTVIRSGDGERAFRFARVNESFRAGVKVPQVLRVVAAKMGLGLGNLNVQSRLIGSSYVQGYTAHGLASKELDRILVGQGYTWSIQDGQLQILPKDGVTEDLRVPELTPETGLIGSPEMCTSEKKNGPPVFKFRCLLQHLIRPGGRVVVRSEFHDGTFKIIKVQHVGDTAGGDWYSNVEANAL